jgi:hypothetical protein
MPSLLLGRFFLPLALLADVFLDLGMLWDEQNAPRRIPVPLNLEKANTHRLFQIRAEMTPDQIDRLERHR